MAEKCSIFLQTWGQTNKHAFSGQDGQCHRSLPAHCCCHGRRMHAQLPPQAAGHEIEHRRLCREGDSGPCAQRSANRVGN